MGKNSWNPSNWFNKDEKNSNIGDMSGMLNGAVSVARNAMDVTNGRSSANMGELKMIEGGRGVEDENKSSSGSTVNTSVGAIGGIGRSAQSLVNQQGIGWKSDDMNFLTGEAKKEILFSIESLGLEMPEEMQGRINSPGIHSMPNSNNGLPKMNFVEDKERFRGTYGYIMNGNYDEGTLEEHQKMVAFINKEMSKGNFQITDEFVKKYYSFVESTVGLSGTAAKPKDLRFDKRGVGIESRRMTVPPNYGSKTRAELDKIVYWGQNAFRVKEERSLAAEAVRKRREAEKIQMSVDNKKRIDDWNSMNDKTLASQESALEKRPEMNEKRKQENLIRTESAKRLEEEEREKVYQEMNELSGNKIIARRGELINEGNNGIYDPQRIQEQAVIERILSERTDVFTKNLRNMKKIIKEKGYTAGREDIEACIRNIEQERRKIEQSDESGLFNYALEKQPSLFEAIMSAPAIWLDLKSLNFPGKTSSDMMIARYESEKFRIELEGEEYKDLTPSVRDSARDFYYVLQLGGPIAVEKFFGKLSGTAKKREAIGPVQSECIDIVHDKIFENMSGVMFEREETQEKLKELSIYGAQSVDSFVKAKVAMTLETMESEGHMPD